MKSYHQYAEDVLSCSIITGKLIKLAVKRFQNDLQNPAYEFRENVVDDCITFIGTLKHFTGSHSGSSFILESWQSFIVANIVGFYYAGTNKRKYSSSYIEVSRKNGKSALAAALCLYFLIADGEDAAEVLLAANSKEQAKISYKFASVYSKQLDPKNKVLKPYRDSITLNLNNSLLKVLAADSSKLDGYNCSFGLIDEWHSSPDSSVRDVIKSSMGMRDNPHICTITTAGFNKSYPCYKLREVGIEILSGIKTDESLFLAIYSLDENDEWDDPEVWAKSNPNLGVTVKTGYLMEQINQAKNNPAEEVGVKTKNLNIWCDSAEVWIPQTYIVDSTEKVNLADYKGKACYIGVDLGATSDLTAVAVLIPLGDKLVYKVHYYLPEKALEDKPDKEMYKLWKQLGYLTTTAGNVTDYDYITKDIVKIREQLNVAKIFYDPYNATQWAIQCIEMGLPLEQYSQNIANFNRPTISFLLWYWSRIKI